MAIITITTPFNIDLEFRVAAFGKRVGAWLIDVVLICLYYYVMLRLIFGLEDKSEDIKTVASLLILIIPVLIYQLASEIFFNGQTIGKRLVGIKVIDKGGQEPTWGQYIIRWMLCIGNLYIYTIPYLMMQSVALVFVFAIIYLPDVIVMLINRNSQRIGDLAAGTVVIDTTYRTSISETIYQEIEVQDYKPLFPQVMRLTDRDINGIRNLLDVKRPGRDSEAYMYQVVYKIKNVLKIESDINGYDFLQQLLHDYNYITSKENK